MVTKKITKKQLTVSIIDQGIFLLENALKSNENAIAFRNSLYEKYDTGIVSRGNLFRRFYSTFKPWFGDYIPEKTLKDPKDMWPYYIDEMTAECIEKYVSERKYQKYGEHQEKMYDKLFEFSDNMKYNDLRELLFTDFHNDFFYVSALHFYNEHPELFK